MEKRDVNLLLIGDTGNGKSGFINSFEKLVVHKSLDLAVKNVSDLATPMKFCHDGEEIREPIPQEENTPEMNKAGSQTDTPVVFEYQTKHGTIRLIDTPGSGDTSGEEADERHIANIVSCLRQFDKVHGILFFFKSSDNRFGETHKRQLCKLLSFLGKTAVASVNFIITHAGPHRRIAQVQAVLEDLNRCLLVEIPCQDENTFFFENYYMQYLILKKHNKSSFTERSVRIFARDFEENATECLRLLRKICCTRTPYEVSHYHALATARQLRAKLERQFLDAQNQRHEMQEIEREKATIRALGDLIIELEEAKRNIRTVLGTFVDGLQSFHSNHNYSHTEKSPDESSSWLTRATKSPYAPHVATLLGVAAVSYGIYDYRDARKRRAELQDRMYKSSTERNEHNVFLEQLERKLEEKVQLCQLQKDIERFLFENAILVSEGSSEAQIEISPALSWSEIMRRVERLTALQQYGREISRVLDEHQRESSVNFDTTLRTNVACGYMFDEIYKAD